ncbi:hypothetical protein JW948_06460 [bacterium]|nr:hypothetical protein [bacterium]
MDPHPFEILEKKIDQLLNLVNALKRENQELRQKNAEIKHILEEKENKFIGLENELEKYRNAQLEVAEYKDKQDRVKNKVEKLIEKLKEFEALE